MRGSFLRFICLFAFVFSFPTCQSAHAKKVDIYWTEHGVPHIEAADWYSLGYGSAYAMAQQNFCILADQLLKIRSERAKYFGAGDGSANIISDVGNLALGYLDDGKALYKELSPRAQQLIRGYAAGFNYYISERSPDQYPRPCKDAAWVKPTTEYELLAYYLSLAERASGQLLLPASVNATPPAIEAKVDGDKNKKVSFNMSEPGAYFPVAQLPNLDSLRLGSNAWSIGKEMSEKGDGLLLGNPHFPGYGALRFYQYRQRIPGVYDVQGASLVGTPCIQIGFNDNLGWTHTVSKSRHFNFYVLELNPANPLEYRYGNEFRPITKKDIQIQLLLTSGQVVPYTRPMYFSHYGPMVATPELKWERTSAFTYRDANKRNTHFIDQWIDMGAAKGLTQFKGAFQKYRGTPWVNTIYSDKEGNAFYIEGTPVPKLSQEAILAWKQNPMAQVLYQKMGAFLFNGSNPRDEWQGSKTGLVPYSEAPQLLRKDYVANQNDSHWLINENKKLNGFSPVYGPEQTMLSYRTRMGLKMLKDQSSKDKLFNIKEVEGALYSNRSYLWENLGEELKARCATWPEPQLKVACASLSLWNGRYDLDSKGFAAFREFATLWDSKLHKVAFQVADPLNTPSGLADEASPVDGIKSIFLKVADNLAKVGFAASASVREIQFFKLPDFEGGVKEKISYHGGLHEEGAFNVQDWDLNNHLTAYAYPEVKTTDFINEKSTLTKEGYGINGGSSFIMLAEFSAKGPKVRGILSYSQSSDPDSPYFADQNYLYQQKKMRDFPHAWRDIEWGNYKRQTLVLK